MAFVSIDDNRVIVSSFTFCCFVRIVIKPSGVLLHGRFHVSFSYIMRQLWPVQTKDHKIIHPPNGTEWEKSYKILLAFSGMKHNLTTNPGYNSRVAECQEAARLLLEYALILVTSNFPQ